MQRPFKLSYVTIYIFFSTEEIQEAVTFFEELFLTNYILIYIEILYSDPSKSKQMNLSLQWEQITGN